MCLHINIYGFVDRIFLYACSRKEPRQSALYFAEFLNLLLEQQTPTKELI
jgi:hypothetical protein